MKPTVLKGLKTTLGIILILFGLIGLVVPILQGWLLIFAGIILIKPEYGKSIKDRIRAWWHNKKSQ